MTEFYDKIVTAVAIGAAVLAIIVPEPAWRLLF